MDQLSLTQVLPADSSTTPGHLWNLLVRCPELLWGHFAPDLVPGTEYSAVGEGGITHEGTVLAVEPGSATFSWGLTGWPEPAVLTISVASGADPEGPVVDSGTAGSGTAARLTLLVAGEDGTVSEMPAIRAFWEPVLDGVARFAASERDDSAPGTPIRAVLFDADGVLQLPGEGWMDRMTVLAGPDFVRAAFATEPGSLTGTRDHGEQLEPLLAETDATVEQVLEIWHDIVPDPDAFALVDRVRASGLVTGLATNQQNRRGTFMRTQTDTDRHFDRHYYSFEVGHAKPTREYFDAIVADLGLEPHEVAFVDDHPANVVGAREAGLRAALHRSTSGAAGLAEDLRSLGVPV